MEDMNNFVNEFCSYTYVFESKRKPEKAAYIVDIDTFRRRERDIKLGMELSLVNNIFLTQRGSTY